MGSNTLNNNLNNCHEEIGYESVIKNENGYFGGRGLGNGIGSSVTGSHGMGGGGTFNFLNQNRESHFSTNNNNNIFW